MPTQEQIDQFRKQKDEAEANARRLALLNQSLESYGQRPYGVQQPSMDTLRPQTRLPESEEEMVARRNVEFLQAVHKLPQDRRDSVLQASTYEPGAFDYLNQASASFNDAVARGVGSPIKGIALANDVLGRITGRKQSAAYENPIYHFGQRIQDATRRGLDATSFLTPTTTPETQDSFLAATVPSAIGSVLTTAAPALIPGVGPALALGSGAAQQSVSEYEQAIKAGATPGEAATVGAINAPIGATDALTGLVGSRILKKGLTGLAGSGVGPLVANIGKGAATEGVQEGSQQALSNLTARIYDPERELTEGVLESAAAGGIAGGGFTGTLHTVPKIPGLIDKVLGAQPRKPTAELTPAPGAKIQETTQLPIEVLEALAEKNAQAERTQEPTDAAQPLQLPANAQLVDEQGNVIQQAPTPPLITDAPQLNIPERSLNDQPGVRGPVEVPQEVGPRVAPAPVAPGAAVQPQAQAPIPDQTTPTPQVAPPDVIEEPQPGPQNVAQATPQNDPRSDIRRIGPPLTGAKMEVSYSLPENAPVDELRSYFADKGQSLSLSKTRKGWKAVAGLQRTDNFNPQDGITALIAASRGEPISTIQQPDVPVAQVNAPSNAPTGEITYGNDVPQTEQAQQGQQTQRHPDEASQGQGQEGLQVDQVVRAGAIRAAAGMSEPDYNAAGYNAVLDYPTAKQESLTLGPGAGTDATPAPESAHPALKIGDPQRVMNVDSVLANTETIDGVRYELYNAAKLKDPRGFVRVIDESGGVADLRGFRNYDAAEKAYNDAIQKSKPAAQPTASEPGTYATFSGLRGRKLKAAVDAAPGTQAWQMTRAQAVEYTNWGKKPAPGDTYKPNAAIREEAIGDAHKASVKTALAEGKPVPAEVLAEYPDLSQPDAKVVAFEQQATQHLPEQSRPVVQQAIKEGRVTDAVDLSATGEDLRQVADLTDQLSPEPAAQPAPTVEPQTEPNVPEEVTAPDTATTPTTPTAPTIFTDEAAEEAYRRIATKLGGSTFSNAVFDPEIWADLVKIAGNYAEKAIRAAAATGFSTYRDFSKYMRSKFAGVEVNVGGFPVDLGSYLAAIDRGAHMRRLWLTTRKVPERKALAGSLKRQKAAASIGYRAATFERSIKKNMNGLRASSIPAEIRNMARNVSWDLFDKSDMIEKMRRINVALADMDEIGGSPVSNAVFDRLAANKGKLDRLSLPELESLKWMVKSFKHFINEYNTERAESFINQVRSNGERVSEEVATEHPKDIALEGFKLLPQAARKWLGQFMRDPETFTQRLGGIGSLTKKIFFHNFEKGWDSKLTTITDSNDVVRSVEKQHKMQSRQKLVDFNTKRADHDINGESVSLTQGEVFGLYMLGQSPKARAHVLGNTWTTEPTKNNPGYNHTFTEQTFADVENYVTPFMRDLRDVMFPMIESLYEPMSKAKEQITGAPMGTQGPNYWPLSPTRTQQEQGMGELATTFGRKALENRNITLPRTGGTPDNPYVIRNGLHTYQRYIDNATDVAFLSIPARMANAVLGQPGVRHTIRKKIGEHGEGALKSLVHTLSGNALPDSDPIRREVNNAVRAWASVLSKGRLGFRATSVAKQLAGIPMAMVEMTNDEMAAVPGAMTKVATQPYLSAVDRSLMSVNPQLRFRIDNQEGHGQAEPRGLGTLDVGKSKFGALIADVQQAGLAPLGWGDNLITKVVWLAVRKANPKADGETDADFNKRTADRAASIIRATQNPVTPLDMSLLQSSMRGSSTGPLIFMLTSSSSKIRNTLDRAVQRGGFAAAKGVVGTLGALMLSAGITAAHSSLVWGLGKNKKDDKFQHFLKRYASSLIGELTSTAVPGVSDTIDSILTRLTTGVVKDTHSVLPTGSIEAVLGAMLANEVKGDRVAYTLLRFLADAAPHFGVPSYPIEVPTGVVRQKMNARGRGGSRRYRR